MDLPIALLSAIVQTSTKPGSVVKMYSAKLVGPSKEKFFVIFNQSTCTTKYGCVLINSSNYPNVHDEHSIKTQQLLAKVSTYKDFLKHDSYFDCSDIKELLCTEVHYMLQADLKRVLGKVTDADLNLIVSALKMNRTLSPKQKKLFSLV